MKRVRPLQTSAFDIDLPDNAVDSIFCMRLLHHIGDPAHRLAILREFQRVTRDSVIISLWVDGNFKAWKRKRLEGQRRRKVSRKVTKTDLCYQLLLLRQSSKKPVFVSRSLWTSYRCTPCGECMYCARGSRMAVECVAGSHVAPEDKFDYFWRQQGEWVEEPNRRRGGEKRCATRDERQWPLALQQAPDRASIAVGCTHSVAHRVARAGRHQGPALVGCARTGAGVLRGASRCGSPLEGTAGDSGA